MEMSAMVRQWRYQIVQGSDGGVSWGKTVAEVSAMVRQ